MDLLWLRRAKAGIRAHETERGAVAGGETASTPPDAPTPPGPGRGRLLRARAGLRAHESQRIAPLEPGPAGAEAPPPERIGPYLVEKELGRGGAGVVYAARDPTLGRRVAIKLVRPERARPELLERFHIEGRAAARLRHPHIVTVHEVGEEGGRPYLVMELIEGRSLSVRIRADGPLPGKEVGRIGAALARALGYAHERLILHRDLKPANVLLGPGGEALLSDFGLAKEIDPDRAQGPTVTGQVMGTPAYMPPEQASGAQERVDQRSDVYSLGATLYEALAGVPPFPGDSLMDVLQRVASPEPVPALRALRPDVDRDLATVVMRCLEKDPADRYPTADAVASDLERWLRDEPILARPPSPAERARKWVRRNRGLARASGLLALLLLALGGASGAAFLVRLQAEKERADAAARDAEAAARRARARASLAQQALGTLVHEVRDELGDVPGERVRQVRARLLEAARLQLERLRDPDMRDDLLDLEAAEAERQVGEIAAVTSGLGPARARESFRRAEVLARRALARDSGPDARRGLVGALRGLAEAEADLGDGAAAAAIHSEVLVHARAWLAQARDERERVAAERALGLSLLESGDLASRRGDTVAGGQAIAAAVSQLRPIRGLELALARGLISLGEDAEMRGDHAAAARAHDEAVERLRAAGSRAAAIQLLYALERAARVREDQGDSTRALALLREGEARSRELRDQDPTDLAVRSARAIVLGRLVTVLRGVESLAEAATTLRELVAERRELVTHSGGSAGQRWELGHALLELGELELARNAHEPARKALDEARAIQGELAAVDSRSTGPRQSLAQVLSAQGRLCEHAGDMTGAAQAYREGIALRRRLAEEDPAAVWAQGLVTALIDLGEVELHAGGRPDEARACFEEARDRCRALAERDPTDAGHMNNLELVLGKLSTLQLRRGDPKGAIAALREAIGWNDRRLALDPKHPRTRRDRAVRHQQLAQALIGTRDLAGAEEALGAASALLRTLTDEGAVDAASQLGMCLTQEGDLREARQDLAGAALRYRESVELFRGVIRAGQADGYDRRHLTISLERLCTVRLNQGDGAEALPLAEETLAVRQELLARDPKSALARRDAIGGWVLVANAKMVAEDLPGSLAAWEEAVALGRALAEDVPGFARELVQIERGRNMAAERVTGN